MKKSNFVALPLGTIGGVCFALGMCMALLPEWGMFQQGIVCGVIGLVICDAGNPFFLGIAQRLEAMLDRRGYRWDEIPDGLRRYGAELE